LAGICERLEPVGIVDQNIPDLFDRQPLEPYLFFLELQVKCRQKDVQFFRQ